MNSKEDSFRAAAGLALVVIIFSAGFCNADDPFAPGAGPASISDCNWSALATEPVSYHGAIVALTGWISVAKVGSAWTANLNRLKVRSTDAKQVALVGLEGFHEFTIKVGNSESWPWLLLSGKRVEVTGKLMVRSNRLYLSLPYEIRVLDLQGAVIKDSAAVWEIPASGWPGMGKSGKNVTK
jgi:hypothetical protein